MRDVEACHTVRVAFRADASSVVGLGHLRRCLALAHAVRALGGDGIMLVNGDDRALELAMAAGFQASAVARGDDPGATVEWCERLAISALVVDTYAFSADDFRAVGAVGRPVIAFDDMADRQLPVDLVINGGLGAERLLYRDGEQTRYLLGPRYLALPPEFADVTPRAIHEHVTRALVTVGGADPGRLTDRFVRCAITGLGAVTLDVVIGPLVADVACIRAAVSGLPGAVVLHENPKHLRDLMLAADVALAGGGHTVYELAATGTPTVAVRLAANQTSNIESMRSAGMLVYAGDVHDVGLERGVETMLAALAVDPGRRADMSRRCRALVDGRGADRVARALLDLARSPQASG